MEPVGLDFINQRVSPWFRDWVREAAALADRAGRSAAEAVRDPGTRQLQPVPLERPPAALLGVVIVPGG